MHLVVAVANAWQCKKDFARRQQNATPVILTIDHDLEVRRKEVVMRCRSYSRKMLR